VRGRVELRLVDGLGHAWPQPSSGFDASHAIADFSPMPLDDNCSGSWLEAWNCLPQLHWCRFARRRSSRSAANPDSEYATLHVESTRDLRSSSSSNTRSSTSSRR
jgi:hypothetical protein